MILLVSGAHQLIAKHESKHLGWLLNPRAGASIETIVRSGVVWAADNDCYQGLNKTAYMKMLRKIASASNKNNLRFVVAPDVLTDALGTLVRFRMWYPVLKYYNLPVALVAQDGQESLSLPWLQIDALFIGGSTAWKEGPHAGRLIQEAKHRGKWIHVGRVNSYRRAELVGAWGADSIDGSGFSRFPDRDVPPMLRRLPYKQHGMMEVLCSS